MVTLDPWEKARKRILFVGTSGSGKTTLINELLGERHACLSAGVTTETVTSIRWGERRSSRVVFRDPVTKKSQRQIPARAVSYIAAHNVPFHPVLVKGVPPMDVDWEDRSAYISPREVRQPAGPGAVTESPFARMELTVTAPMLKKGIVLVDTCPVLAGGDSSAEQELLQADLVVYVTKARASLDPGEREFLQKQLLEKNFRNVCFAVTHMDRLLKDSERERVKKTALSELHAFTDLGEEGIFFLSNPGAGKTTGRAKAERARLEQLICHVPQEPAGCVESAGQVEEKEFTERPGQGTSLDPHIAFATQLIGKYQWSHPVRRNLLVRLDEIQKKQKDKNLNLSIIGEFSSGKSTFINALLRMDLLAANVLQGTTVASTVIEYGTRYGITMRGPEGTQRTQNYGRMQDFQKQLNRLVADNEDAEGMGEVVVSLPSRSLQSWNCRIIDTPGLNATVHWHEDVTIQTIQERSDLSIILVDAVRPLPEDLCLFIEDYLTPVLEQCIFVVTKIDLIPPRERNRMIKYVQRSVQNKFGIENPLVLPYSSADVVNTFAPGTFAKGRYESDAEVSFESEKRILEHMALQRNAAQTKKLLSLADMIYEEVRKQLQELTDTYQERLALMERTGQEELKPFIAEQKVRCLKHYDTETTRMRAMVDAAGRRYADQAWNLIRERIEQQTSAESLKDYLENSVKSDCEELAEKLGKMIVKKALRGENIPEVADQVLRSFRAAFQQHFRGLECLIPEHRSKTIVPPRISMPDVRAINIAEKYAGDMAKRESKWGGRGAAIGAALGSAIAPGPGTIIGLVAGFLGGRSGGRSSVNLREMQDTIKAQLEEPLLEYFAEVARQTCAGVGKYTDNIRGQICKEIERYLKAYRTTVDQWIRAEQVKKAQLEDQMETIREDMHQIDLRRESLETIRKQIRPNWGEEE